MEESMASIDSGRISNGSPRFPNQQSYEELNQLLAYATAELESTRETIKAQAKLFEARTRHLEEIINVTRRERDQHIETIQELQARFVTGSISMVSGISQESKLRTLPGLPLESVSSMPEPSRDTLTEAHRKLQGQQHQHSHQQQQVEFQKQLEYVSSMTVPTRETLTEVHRKMHEQQKKHKPHHLMEFKHQQSNHCPLDLRAMPAPPHLDFQSQQPTPPHLDFQSQQRQHQLEELRHHLEIHKDPMEIHHEDHLQDQLHMEMVINERQVREGSHNDGDSSGGDAKSSTWSEFSPGVHLDIHSNEQCLIMEDPEHLRMKLTQGLSTPSVDQHSPPRLEHLQQQLQHPTRLEDLQQQLQHPTRLEDLQQQLPHPTRLDDLQQQLQHPTRLDGLQQQLQHPTCLDDLQQLQHPARLEDLQQLQHPTRLDDLQPLQHPTRLDDLQTLQHPSRLDDLQPLQHPSRLDDLQQLQHPTRLDDLQQLQHPTRLDDLQQLQHQQEDALQLRLHQQHQESEQLISHMQQGQSADSLSLHLQDEKPLRHQLSLQQHQDALAPISTGLQGSNGMMGMPSLQHPSWQVSLMGLSSQPFMNGRPSGIGEQLLQSSCLQGGSFVASILSPLDRYLDGTSGNFIFPHHLPEPPESDPQVMLSSLPEKGKLLQAVIQAGPLLHTLMVAGELPQWRHPPPILGSEDIPRVSMSMSVSGGILPPADQAIGLVPSHGSSMEQVMRLSAPLHSSPKQNGYCH